MREWRGRTHTVQVTEDGFEYDGKPYSSLSKIAHAITGAHWSGPRFFGLNRKPTPGPQDFATHPPGARTPMTRAASRGTQVDRFKRRCAIYTRKSSEEGLERVQLARRPARGGVAYIQSQKQRGLDPRRRPL